MITATAPRIQAPHSNGVKHESPPDPTVRKTVMVALDLSTVEPSPLNPRKYFDAEGLEELAQSIKENGLIQPLSVRRATGKKHAGHLYELIAGERRYRACKLAGLSEAPALLFEGVSDSDLVKLATIENLQRVNINPMEQAGGFQSLADLGMTQTEIAYSVGVKQPLISKYLSLLKLPEKIQRHIRESKLSAEHGRILADLADFPDLCQEQGDYCVRQRVPAKELEKTGAGLQARSWELKQKGLVMPIEAYSCVFDWQTICKECPYDAFRQTPSPMCLKPSHFEELNKAAAEEKQKAIKQQAKDAGGVLPSIEKLDPSQYIFIHKDAAPGCLREKCECFSQVSLAGGIADICTRPDRYRKFMEEGRLANKRAMQRTGERVLKATVQQIDTSKERDLLPVVLTLLFRLNPSPLAASLKRQGLTDLSKVASGRAQTKEIAAALRKETDAGAARLVMAAIVESYLTCEIETRFQYGHSEILLTEAFMGWAPGKIPDELVVSPTDPPDEKPLAEVFADCGPGHDAAVALSETAAPSCDREDDLDLHPGFCVGCNAEIPEHFLLCPDCDPGWLKCKECRDQPARVQFPEDAKSPLDLLCHDCADAGGPITLEDQS